MKRCGVHLKRFSGSTRLSTGSKSWPPGHERRDLVAKHLCISSAESRIGRFRLVEVIDAMGCPYIVVGARVAAGCRGRIA